MADLQKISQIVLQVATGEDRQKISQLVLQVAYEEGTDTPTQEQLMRHGCWFSDGVKKPFWWAK